MTVFTKKGSPFKYVRFTVTDKTTGRSVNVYESTRETTLAKAREYEAKRKEGIKQQLIYGQKPRHTWLEAERRWLSDMSHKRSLDCDVEKFDFLRPLISNKYLDEVNKDLIDSIVKEKYKNNKNLSNATVNRLLALIRAVLNRAYKHWEWIDKVPSFSLKPENNSRTRYLTPEEFKTLLKHLPKHLQHLVRFSVATGQRANNVLTLRWEDIDLNKKVWIITPDKFKTNKLHMVPLNSMALEVLNELTGNSGILKGNVFTYKGNPIRQCNTKAFRQALEKAGIKDFRWHDLRHTWASWHIQNKTPLQILQQLGGWTDYKMVLRYAHLDPEQLIKASENITGKVATNKVNKEVEDVPL